MTVTKGFIVLNSEGFYAREYEINTHGGRKNMIEWVKDINRATVFINQVHALRRHIELNSKAMVRAEVTRVVRITGAE